MSNLYVYRQSALPFKNAKVHCFRLYVQGSSLTPVRKNQETCKRLNQTLAGCIISVPLSCTYVRTTCIIGQVNLVCILCKLITELRSKNIACTPNEQSVSEAQVFACLIVCKFQRLYGRGRLRNFDSSSLLTQSRTSSQSPRFTVHLRILFCFCFWMYSTNELKTQKFHFSLVSLN